MKISIMSGAFESSLDSGLFTIDALLDSLSDAGATGLELSWEWCKRNHPTWLALRNNARKRGFSFPNVYAPADLCEVDEKTNQETLQNLRQIFIFCRAEINCPLVLLYGSAPPPGMDLSEARRNYGTMLARCAELGAEYGVTVCIEDFGGNPQLSSTSAHCLEILSYANSSLPRLNFDNGNVLLGDEGPLDALQSFIPHLIHVHIKDFKKLPAGAEKGLRSVAGARYQNCVLGSGDAEVVPCINRLHEIGYQGWLSAEIRSDGDLAWIHQEVKFIADALRQLPEK